MKLGEKFNEVWALMVNPSGLWCCKLKKGVFLAEQLCDVDVNNPPQGSRACSLPAYRTLTPLNAPRPAWQLCCHRVVTCQILMNMQCVLFFCLMHDNPPLHHHHHHLLPFSPRAWCTPGLTPVSSRPHPHHLTHLPGLTPVTPSLTPLYVLLHGLWRRSPSRRLAWHWPPTPQDHSGTLGAEEFKACLISLGFDIANDAQVLRRSLAPATRSLTGFLFLFFFYSLSLPTFTADPLLSKCVGFSTPCNVLLHGLLWSFLLNSSLWLILLSFHPFPPLSLFFSISLVSWMTL